MLAKPRSEQDEFLQLVTQVYGDIALKDALKRLRAKSWDRFLQLGLPSRSLEVYRYIRLRSLFGHVYEPGQSAEISKADLESYIYPECRQSVIVFVNGYFQPSLSDTAALPSKVVVSTLNDAMRSYSAFLDNHWAKTTKDENDPFAVLNAALHPQGAFVYLPPQTIVSAPVQVLNLITSSKTLIMPRLLLFVGRQSEVTIAETAIELNCSGYCLNQVTECVIEEGAHAKFFSESSGLSPDAWHLNALRASLKRDSTLKAVAFTDGAMTVRNDYHVTLTGEGGDACLNGVCMLDEKREAHTNILMDHQAPSCRSNQLFKGVLTDVSRSSFEGKIYVRQAAQKTEAYQLNNNLILSDKANADSKPNLEIFADDVKASHGATVGQLDPEQLFYCRTRGYSEDEARNLLIHGYCEEVIDLITIPSVHERLTARARRFLV